MIHQMFDSQVLGAYQTILGIMLAELDQLPAEDRNLDWIFRRLLNEAVGLQRNGDLSRRQFEIVRGLLENLAENVGYQKTDVWPIET